MVIKLVKIRLTIKIHSKIHILQNRIFYFFDIFKLLFIKYLAVGGSDHSAAKKAKKGNLRQGWGKLNIERITIRLILFVLKWFLIGSSDKWFNISENQVIT